jgi:hypothetical protein
MEAAKQKVVKRRLPTGNLGLKARMIVEPAAAENLTTVQFSATPPVYTACPGHRPATSLHLPQTHSRRN